MLLSRFCGALPFLFPLLVGLEKSAFVEKPNALGYSVFIVRPLSLIRHCNQTCFPFAVPK
jgi:hypothetical protein